MNTIFIYQVPKLQKFSFYYKLKLFGSLKLTETCYCGDFDGTNSFTADLTDTVDVYLKDDTKSSNDAFKNCQATKSAPAKAPVIKRAQGKTFSYKAERGRPKADRKLLSF